MSRYPEIVVDLDGKDSNALMIIGAVAKALRRARVSEEEIKTFRAEATSGDYDHVIQTAMAWVEVE